MQKIAIITGASKGIGEGIALAYQQNGYHIISISRTKNENLQHIQQIEFDLSKTIGIEDLVQKILGEIEKTKVEKITLINNAGTLGKIGRLEDITDIAETVQLNTTAPLILTAIFLKLTHNWACEKTIINISSGAAAKPYSGWTVYCATKAALDMMTQTIALEQEGLINGAKVIAIYPGVVDTDMQAQIRTSDKNSFAAIDRFLDLKANNALADATTVGQQIFTAAHDNHIKNGTILRIES